MRLTILQATHTDRAGSGFVNTTFSTPNMNTNVISVMIHGPDGNATIVGTNKAKRVFTGFGTSKLIKTQLFRSRGEIKGRLHTLDHGLIWP